MPLIISSEDKSVELQKLQIEVIPTPEAHGNSLGSFLSVSFNGHVTPQTLDVRALQSQPYTL